MRFHQQKAGLFLQISKHVAAKARRWRFRNSETLFTHYYNTGFWGNGNSETVCGRGSTMGHTENIRREIPVLINRLSIAQILDAPCGDYNWFQAIPRDPETYYVGGDIVQPMIARNNQLYADSSTRFVHLDITQDSLPDADLWLCRDCLPHFSNEDIFKTIDNFLRSRIRYLLATTHTECRRNTDVPTGSFRPLNLELPPFNFRPALLYIDDWVEGRRVKKLGLWEWEMLAQDRASRPRFA